MKTDSIFKQVLVKILATTLVPLILLILVASVVLCVNHTERQTEAVTQRVEDCVTSTKEVIYRAVLVSEYIQGYPYILNNMERKFQNAYEVLDYINNVNIYIDNIEGGFEELSCVIYFSNETLFESKYFHRVEELAEYQALLQQFEERNNSFIWDPRLHEDEAGKKYIIFYKKFPFSSKNILECKICLPETVDNIEFAEKESAASNAQGYIIRSLNEQFIAQSRVDQHALFLQCLAIMLSGFFVIIVLTVLICFVAWGVVSKTTYDITAFINKMNVEEVADLEVNFDQKPREAKELRTIKKTVLKLCNQIKKAELEKKNVEIELVQSKINPHAMYNSLSAIRLMAFESKEEGIIRIVDNMVEYYRMVLNKGKNITIISDEITMLKKYLIVNEQSNYIRYQFITDIPTELLNCQIPHLLLLPFVENSVMHGLSSIQEDGFIKVSCRRDGEYLSITVADNGIGIKPEKLQQLNDLENCNIGYGIRNVYMRLKLIYGSESKIIFRSKYNEGTEVCMRFRYFDEKEI